jgi:hypothetical protein
MLKAHTPPGMQGSPTSGHLELQEKATGAQGNAEPALSWLPEVVAKPKWPPKEPSIRMTAEPDIVAALAGLNIHPELVRGYLKSSACLTFLRL